MITKSERYREVLAVLARHRIGVVEDQLIKHEARDRARAEHLRRACEELGAMFIKLGQLLSTRGDLLPEAYRTELAKLQDEVAQLPVKVIAEVIREDLGAPPDQIFAFFDPEPLGSASIGQVHAARLADGREVVLKVRKPGVDDLVHVDLEILAGLVEAWSPRFPILEQYDARGLLREFSDALRAELDYGHEATNGKLFRTVFANERGFTIPEVIDKYSKGRVLTEERVRGRKPSDVAHLPPRRRAVVSRRIARFVLEPAFERGVYYADPHPGNLLIQDDGSLAIVDFGKIGHLTPDVRRRVADMFVAIERGDAQRLADRLIEVTAPTHPIDRAVITREIDRMLELYVDVSLEHVRFGDAIGEVLQLVRSDVRRDLASHRSRFELHGLPAAHDRQAGLSGILRSSGAGATARCGAGCRGAWHRAATTRRPPAGRGRARQSTSLDARRRYGVVSQAPGAPRPAAQRDAALGGVHRGARDRHAVLPSARLAGVDRGGVLDRGGGRRRRRRESPVGHSQVSG